VERKSYAHSARKKAKEISNTAQILRMTADFPSAKVVIRYQKHQFRPLFPRPPTFATHFAKGYEGQEGSGRQAGPVQALFQ
jgi:hypothetical protein